MKFNKGDLVLINTIDEKKITCIIVSIFDDNRYLYAYCLESGEYQLIYDREVEFIITKEFAPNFPTDPGFFNLDYSFYEAAAYGFNYIPFFAFPAFSDYDEPEDDDE